MKILSRRNAMYAALIAAAFGSAVTAAVATTAIASGAPMIQTTATVSPRMAELVASYKASLETVDTLAPDDATDEATWSAVEAAFLSAQAALLAERPANAADFALKFDSLVEIEAAEGQYDVFKRLSEDAHALAQGAN